MNQQGLSLLEVLITVGIVGVLSSLCYPQYQQYIARTRQSQALWQLQHLANQLDHQYLHQHRFNHHVIALPHTPGYRFSIHLPTPHRYTITAEPSAQQNRYSPCGTLTLQFQQRIESSRPQQCHLYTRRVQHVAL